MKLVPLAVLLLSLFISTSFAAHKKAGHPAAPMLKVTEVSGASITLSAGHTGEMHETFKITGQTKVTVDGIPATADGLRAGMKASVTPAGDGSAAAIHAVDAPRHPARGRVG